MRLAVKLTVIPFVLLASCCGVRPAAQAPAPASSSAFERLDGAEVVIRVIHPDGAGAMGSGVVIGRIGLRSAVLTVSHLFAAEQNPGGTENVPIGVCDSEDDDEIALGHLEAIDRKHDLALISLDRPLVRRATRLAAREPELFDDLFQLGGVYGSPHIAAHAVLSSKGRKQTNLEGRYYQITGACWPGMSGSPLANAAGEVVGIMRALYVDEEENRFVEVCYAVPLPALQKFVAGRVQ